MEPTTHYDVVSRQINEALSSVCPYVAAEKVWRRSFISDHTLELIHHRGALFKELANEGRMVRRVRLGILMDAWKCFPSSSCYIDDTPVGALVGCEGHFHRKHAYALFLLDIACRDVKSAVRCDKAALVTRKASDIAKAAEGGLSKALYDATLWFRRKPKPTAPIRR